MKRTFMPKTMWGVTYPGGSLSTFTIRQTRKESREAFCDNGDYPADDWNDLARRGYRSVKVRVEAVTK